MQRNARTCIIAQYNRDTHAFIRRRVRVADPDAILQLRLPPPPLPLSWGKAIKPYRPVIVAASSNSAAAAAAGEAEAPVPAPAAAEGQEAAAGEAQVVVPRGLVGQPCALPASRNCTPRLHDHTFSSSPAGVLREWLDLAVPGTMSAMTCLPMYPLLWPFYSCFSTHTIV